MQPEPRNCQEKVGHDWDAEVLRAMSKKKSPPILRSFQLEKKTAPGREKKCSLVTFKPMFQDN